MRSCPALPFKLVLKKVDATPDGLAVTATATNVPLNSADPASTRQPLPDGGQPGDRAVHCW